MIVKKIERKRAGGASPSRRAGHARALVDYLHSPEKESAEKAYMVDYMLRTEGKALVGERLIHAGARGLVSETAEGQRAEMIALARAAERSESPVDHWLLSWREGEIPTINQLEQVADMFLDHLGVKGQPCIFACHGDTHNRHLHFAINRYDSAAERMRSIHNYWDINAGHEAVALIVDRFGWQAEENARYEVVDGRPVLTDVARAAIEEGAKPIRAGAAAAEVRTGYRSTQRIVLQVAVPIIRKARSWRELHERLAAEGIAYDKRGTNGAIITIGDKGVGASGVHRQITRVQLEKRLGAFEARDGNLAIRPRDPERDRLPHAWRADEYRAQREAMERWKKGEAARKERERRHQDENEGKRRLRELARARRETPSIPQKPPTPPPNLESFLYRENEGEMAWRWRQKPTRKTLPSITGSKLTGVRDPEAVGEFKPFVCSDGVRYALDEQSGTAFVDRGSWVDVVMAQDDAAVLAALRLGVAKFGRITVRGSAEFREKAFALAMQYNLAQQIDDKELQQRLAALDRQRSSTPVSPAKEPGPLSRTGVEKLPPDRSDEQAPPASSPPVASRGRKPIRSDDRPSTPTSVPAPRRPEPEAPSSFGNDIKRDDDPGRSPAAPSRDAQPRGDSQPEDTRPKGGPQGGDDDWPPRGGTRGERRGGR